MKKLHIHSFDTPMGMIRTAATERGLAIVTLPDGSEESFEAQIEKLFADHQICSANSINREAEAQICAFLEGNLKAFSIKLDLRGTSFQKEVLREVTRIPYGTTMSYGEIAAAVGNPRACRAVGTVNARNLLPLFIPCHRVVAANGLGGYGGGLGMKKQLLKLEGALQEY